MVLGLAASARVYGQQVIEPPVINPGARSLGLGGAFVALADDATAAYSNPAGLIQLTRPEISFELRGWGFENNDSVTNASGVGFGSFVFPRTKWALAIYGQTQANIDFGGNIQAEDEIEFATGLAVINLGLSGAYKVSDKLSFGAGLVGVTAAYDALRHDLSGMPFDSPTEVTSTSTEIVLGGIWQPAPSWSVGFSHRGGSKFRFDDEVVVSLPDVTAVGTSWRSRSGDAMLTFELEYFSGDDSRFRPHLGGEWAFLSIAPIVALRAGIWYDPNGESGRWRTITLDSSTSGAVHGSAGIGIAFKKFQLDLGFDVSDVIKTFSLSMIISF